VIEKVGGSGLSIGFSTFYCEIFGALWQHIRNWLGISGAEPYNIHHHFI